MSTRAVVFAVRATREDMHAVELASYVGEFRPVPANAIFIVANYRALCGKVFYNIEKNNTIRVFV